MYRLEDFDAVSPVMRRVSFTLRRNVNVFLLRLRGKIANVRDELHPARLDAGDTFGITAAPCRDLICGGLLVFARGLARRLADPGGLKA